MYVGKCYLDLIQCSLGYQSVKMLENWRDLKEFMTFERRPPRK